MRKIFSMLLLLFIISVFISFKAFAKEQPVKYIALHDEVLSFDEGEVLLQEGQVFVPLVKMSSYLGTNLKFSKDGMTITMTKNKAQLTYNHLTKTTLLNGKMVQSYPIRFIEADLYVPIQFLGEATGYKVDYLPSIQTMRLTNDVEKSMENDAFIENRKHQANCVSYI